MITAVTVNASRNADKKAPKKQNSNDKTTLDLTLTINLVKMNKINPFIK